MFSSRWTGPVLSATEQSVTVHPFLENAATKLGLDLPNIRRASDKAAVLRNQIEESLRKQYPDSTSDHVDVVVFGSIAREEVTTGSDVDFVVVAHALPDSGRLAITRDLLRSMD